MKTVALKAGVSSATVSRTINGSDKVSTKTAEKVKRVIAELHFYPNTNARALGSGRSNLYGLIISDITNPFFPEIVKAFEAVAIEHGQEVIVANTNYDLARMEASISRMVQRKVDGLAIMTSETNDELLEVVRRKEIPLVILDGMKPGPWHGTIRLDYELGIKLALEHLAALGHRRIAFLSGPQQLGSAQVRLQAFREEMFRHGLTFKLEMVKEGDHRVEGGQDAMRRMLSSLGSRKKPTAILASNDLMAIGAIAALKEYGLKVPEDVSVMGFDDIQLSAYTMPALTTLQFSREEIAKAAFRSLLFQRQQSRTRANHEYVVKPRMVLRCSTSKVSRRKDR